MGLTSLVRVFVKVTVLTMNATWFPFELNGRAQQRRPARYRPQRHRGAFRNEPEMNALLFSSSSRLFRGAFVRYTRRIQRLVNRFSFMHRLAFMALFLSILLALAISLAVSNNRDNDGPVLKYDSMKDSPQVSPFDSSPFRIPEYKLSNMASNSENVEATTHALPNPSDENKSFPVNTAEKTDIGNTARHFEDDLIATETNLTSLPHTTWYYEKELFEFRPRHHRSNDLRLISMNNACYCTRRNKFILPRRYRKVNIKRQGSGRFPKFMYRYGAARAVPWSHPKNILAFPSQKVIQIEGTTIFWRGRSLHSPHAHLHRSLIPIRSLVDILKKSRFHSEVRLAAESFDPPDGNKDVTRIQNYYLGDMKNETRISLGRLRPRLVCFRRVIALGSEYENHASSLQVYEHIKDLISAEGELETPLVKFCAARNANTQTIWLMNRHVATSSFGVIENIAEVEILINHELLEMGLASRVDLRIIQAPNLKCPPGTSLEGCYNLDCNGTGDVDGECFHSPSLLHEVQTFNNMTFLITTSGPADEALSYMPRGSQVVELVPYGFLDHSYQQSAEDAHLTHYRVEDHESQDWEQSMYERFGDIARSRQSCWDDLECRTARMTRATHANIHRLQATLKKAIFVWRTACAQEAL